MYPEYPNSVNELEESILAKWREEKTFQQTLEQTEGNEAFVFFEGPPTANGKPGIHHVLSRTLKDLIPRYQTMLGKHVTRIAGWDTHGLPVEIEAEKKLGISGKRQIEEIGVARFNEVCRESVFTYKEDWERLSERIGYWLDYSKPYITMMPEYIESVWNILKRLDDKGLIYRGYKSVPYCPRCGTALSSHEVSLGYEDVRDPSLYFLAPWADDPEKRAFLVWTTTPWTLPANVGLAVHPKLAYVEVEREGRRIVLAESRAHAVFGDDVVIRRKYWAGELVGQRYERPFDLVPVPPNSERAWRVVAEEFVTADDGTGIVHLAPAFGADDYASGQRHGLPMLRPVDDAGRFIESVPLVAGVFVKEADNVLLENLSKRDLVFRYSIETHTYPHCWRCSSPLLYMARDSWYIRTTQIKDVMIRNNNQVNWQPPEVGTGRFGEWLEGNVDWAISRERYWGTPLPIWLCDREREHRAFIGSLAELREKAGELGPNFDPHKPYIDEVTWSCTQCRGTMRRTPEVIDVWFDSGSMPYAQWHYPFENKEQWRQHFPADYICEGVDQTRGWFYSLMAISSMLGDGPAYKNVIVNDLVLDAQGQKMSKSKGNVVDPWDAINSFGVDAIRWYFLTASQPWVPKRFDPEALSEAAHRIFDTLANTYKFFALYANLENYKYAPATAAANVPLMDRWILSRLHSLVADVRRDLDAYDVTRAARAIGEFIVDDVSNWYVRRSRDRFWGSVDDPTTRTAFNTLAEVLTTVSRLLAPVTPFQPDWLHRAITGQSVHLARFPEAGHRDQQLERGMGAIRVLARLGRAARERVKVRVRQPLRTLHAFTPVTGLSDELVAALRDELNVKEVHFLQRSEDLVAFKAQPNFRVMGKRFGARMQEAATRVRELPSAELAAFRSGSPLAIEVGGERFELSGEEIELREEPLGDLLVESDAGYTIALDPRIDEELRLEGIAREVVSRIQRLRRDTGLEVSDRIRLSIAAEGDAAVAIEQYRDYVAHETLAEQVELNKNADSDAHEVELDGLRLRIALSAVK
jgi:isoleucyl-tRNA synthetase